MTQPSPTTIRLDPSPSKVFSWLSWCDAAPRVCDEITGRTIRPAGPTLTVRYRYNGAEWEHWPVSEEEARELFNPSAKYGFSIGSAFSSIIKAHKSGRLVKSGERQETKAQREELKKRSCRRWLA